MVNLLVRGIVMKVQLFLIVKSDVKENAMKNKAYLEINILIMITSCFKV